MQHGGARRGDDFKEQICSLKDAAEALSVSRMSAVNAKAIINSFPEALEHIVSGDVTVADAHSVKDKDDTPADRLKMTVRERYDQNTI